MVDKQPVPRGAVARTPRRGPASGARPVKLDPADVFARNIDWNLFKIFYRIARSGSIGAAARELNRQQPSVSVALQRLEAHLGLPLCVRTRRGITLTAFGADLLKLCKEMNGSIERLPKAAMISKQEPLPPVTLAVISNLHLDSRLNAILAEFHRKMPGTEITLNVVRWFSVIESVLSGDVDIGFGFITDEARDSITTLPVVSRIEQLYCGPGHSLFGRPLHDLKSLRSEPFVISPQELPFDQQFRERHGLGQTIGGISDNLQGRMRLIRLGVGIGLLPKPIVDASEFADELWPLLSDEKAPSGTICLMAKTERLGDVRAQVLWDVACTHLRARGDESKLTVGGYATSRRRREIALTR
jgi:LysR family transcriptional regulator, transcriptional activator for bauABCD operon